MNRPPVRGDMVTDHSENLRWFVLHTYDDGYSDIVRVKNTWNSFNQYLEDDEDLRTKWASDSNKGKVHYSKIDILAHREDQEE